MDLWLLDFVEDSKDEVDQVSRMLIDLDSKRTGENMVKSCLSHTYHRYFSDAIGDVGGIEWVKCMLNIVNKKTM